MSNPTTLPDQERRAIQMSPPRLRRVAGQIHALGPRPLFELLCELDQGADLGATLERYARLPRDFIRQHGGAELPVTRLIKNPGGRA
jgi:hypothetical protein